MRIALYAHAAPDDRETVGSQLARLRVWAQTRDGAQVSEHVYSDIGADVTGLNRAGLARVRLATRRGEVDVLAVTARDRLATTETELRLLKSELRRAGCALVALEQPAPGPLPG